MPDDLVKLTNAVYKILEALPENDPLKNKAKEKALCILENLTLINNIKSRRNEWVSLEAVLKQSYGIDNYKTAALVVDDIEILESYLEIGRSLGWISAVNFLIITKEYHQIKSQITLPKSITKENPEPNEKLSNSEITHQKVENKSIKDNVATRSYFPRQEKILKILKEKENAQVADFIKELPNVTKRTIRRDLDDLLEKQKIVRVGQFNQIFYKIGHL